MARSAEEVQRALDRAREAQDQGAVTALEQMLERMQSQSAPATAPALSPDTATELAPTAAPSPESNYQQRSIDEVGSALERARAAGDQESTADLEAWLSDMQKPALAQPQSTNGELPPIDPSRLPTAPDPDPNKIGLGRSGPALSMEERTRRINQMTYERDQEVLKLPRDHPDRATNAEMSVFRNKHISAKRPDGRPVGISNLSNEIVRDSQTGEIRWAALSPQRMDEIEQKKLDDAQDVKENIGALKYGVINPTGEFIDFIDKSIEARQITQKLIWSQLPTGEQDRIRGRIREDRGDEALEKFNNDVGFFAPSRLKEYMDENPDNETLLDNLEGDEWKNERLGYPGRIYDRLARGMSRGAPDEDAPALALTGRGRFKDVEYDEDEQQPAWPGASMDISDWRSDTKSQGSSLYEHFLKPRLTTEEGETPGERIMSAAQGITKEAYDEKAAASVAKPFIPEGKSWRDMMSTDFWTDPETKMPWNDWTGFKLTFLQNAPQIAVSIGVTRGAGSLSAKSAMSANVGRSLEVAESARRKAAMAGGVFGGGMTEGFLIHNNVAREVGQSLSEVPFKVWEEDEVFNSLVARGLNPEEAKQLLTHDAANTAGTESFWIAGVGAGAPMSAWIGRSGAGRLATKTTAGQVGAALLAEPFQEGTQEVVEGEISDWAIATIDPNNPVFDDVNRRTERFAGGAFVTGPTGVGALATIEYGTPAGYEKADVEAAEQAAKVMTAINKRYKEEIRQSDQKYRDNTSPVVRLRHMQELQNLQLKEAETILAAEKILTEYFEANPSQTSKVELKKIKALAMQANAMKTDIEVARSRLTTATEMAEEQQTIFEERQQLQVQVTEDIVKLEDLQRLAASIESVQNQEAISEQEYEELQKAGYGAWRGIQKDTFVILPKGRRAMNMLNNQAAQITNRLDRGYTGVERRAPEQQLQRDLIETAGPVEREQMLYEDSLTGVQNRRAFNERQEHIDKREEVAAEPPTDEYSTKARELWDERGIAGSHTADDTEQAIRENTGDEAADLYRAEFERLKDAAVAERLAKKKGEPTTEEAAPEKIEGAAPVVAVVDIDSLAWVNDKMGHAAGDRMLVAVADALNKQKGVEVFRTGGDEFAVTGATEEAVEAALQAAAAELANNPVIDGDQEVASSISWGKGELHEQADKEQAAAKERRTSRGQVAARKEKHAGWKARKQLPLFQQGEEFDDGGLQKSWGGIRQHIQRGDHVEILTPGGAVHGVVTRVQTRKSRPRVTVNVHGREYTFNPYHNHLITANVDPADLAWITDEESLGDPMFAPPQVIGDVRLGHIGRQGDYYADLGGVTSKVSQMDRQSGISGYGFWYNEHIRPEWDRYVPFVPRTIEATPEKMKRAEATKGRVTQGYRNLPNITLVGSIKELEQINEELVQQMRAMGASMTGTRGFFDEENPENGIVILVQNIHGQGESFEQNVTETILHELIGHFGIRGLFGNEMELRTYMREMVRAFPKVATRIKGRVLRTPGMDDAAYEQVIGEEMIAYMVGEQMAGTVKLTAPQRNLLQKIYDYVRGWLINHGWGKFFGSEDSFYGFWNDERIQALVARSQDFVRNGNGFSFSHLDGRHTRMMRDADIFQLGVITAMNNATRKASKQERRAMEARYPAGSVPKEIPLFPADVASPNAWINAVRTARSQNLISAKEMELIYMDEKADFNFFRDTTYADLKVLSGTIATDNSSTIEQTWYKQVMSIPLAEEFEALLEIAKNPADYVGPRDRSQVLLDAELRIDEIMKTKMDQKKTQLTKDIVMAYLGSDKVVSIHVMPEGGLDRIEFSEAADRLFGQGNWDVDTLTNDQKEQVSEEKRLSQARGYDIGYDAETQTWFDRSPGYSDYASHSPVGTRSGGDYRVVLIKQKGGGLAVGRSGHFGNTEGVLVHVRTGVSDIASVEGQEMPENVTRPDFKMKVLSMIEMQSDWLQRLRKSWSSDSAYEQGQARIVANQKLLRSANKEMATQVSASFMGHLQSLLDPLMNLPTVPGSVAEQQTLEAAQQRREETGFFNIYEEFQNHVRELYGTTDIEAGLSQDQRDEAAKSFRNAKVQLILRDIERTQGNMAVFMREDRSFEDIQGSLDARTFDKLDRFAVSRIAYSISEDLDVLQNRLRELMDTTTQERFNTAITEVVMTRPFRRLQAAMHRGSSGGSDLRLAQTPHYLKPMVEQLYADIGVDTSSIDQMLERMQTRKRTIFKIPKQRVMDYMHAVESLIPDNIVAEMSAVFENTALLDAGVDTTKVSVTVAMAPSGEMFDIEVVGSDEGIANFKEKIPDIFNRWIATYADSRRSRNMQTKSENLDSKIREHRNRRSDQDLPDFQEVEREFDIDDIDTDTDDPAFADYSITTYESFEEDHLPGYVDSEAADYIENIEWDQIENSNGESLDRDGEAYKDLLVVAENGDVDNEAAEAWIESERTQYEEDVRGEDFIYEQASERVREYWNEDPSSFSQGELPTEWDSEGNVTGTVPLVFYQDSHEGTPEVQIDGDDVYTDYSYMHRVRTNLPALIKQWYIDQEIIPPEGSMFGDPAPADDSELAQLSSERQTLAQRITEGSRPNWEAVKAGMIDEIVEVNDQPVSSKKAFEELVQMQKLSGTKQGTPLHRDQYWRTMTLKYLISDAVRRGLNGIIWNPGMASTARGGMSADGIRTKRISWSLETVTIGGVDKDVWVITSPDMEMPLVLSPGQAVAALGSDVVAYINRQIQGTLPLIPDVKRTGDQPAAPSEPSVSDYLLSRVGDTAHWAIADRAQGNHIEYADSREAAERRVIEMVESRTTAQTTNQAQDYAGTTISARETQYAETPIGEVNTRGEVREDVIGGPISIISGNGVHEYQHTFGIPRIGGARQSYEDITPKIWNKYLKKFGVHITEKYIKVDDLNKSVNEQGGRKIDTNDRGERIAADHGSITVQEVTGEHHGWTVMSERNGPMNDYLHTSRRDAESDMQSIIRNLYGNESGAVKAFYIEINQEMREEHQGSVPPFHYDPREDEMLAGAAEKIGFEPTGLVERYRSWKEAWRDNFNQGVFDRFHGIKRAVSRAGVTVGAERDPYIQTRLTTSLESVMRSVLEYGNPVWKDGIVQSEGRGLLDILTPVRDQLDTWGMYMAGVRSKRLMLEGYSELPAMHRELIDQAASHFEGKTHLEKVFNLLAHVDGYTPSKTPAPTRRSFLKMMGAGAAAAAIPKTPSDTPIDMDALEGYMRTKMMGVRRRGTKTTGKYVPLDKRYRRPKAVTFEKIKELMDKHGLTRDEVVSAMEKVSSRILRRQTAAEAIKKQQERDIESAFTAEDDITKAEKSLEFMLETGREKLFTPTEIKAMVNLGEKNPVFKRVAKEYAAFNSKILDFAQEAGIINADTRPLWENADYIPFYRVGENDRFVGPLSGGAGIANQKSPIKRLKGGEANIGNVIHNIMTNVTKLVDSSMKNHAALLAVDALRGSGIISKQPMTYSQELIPLNQIKKMLLDQGINPEGIPVDALEGIQKMSVLQPPSGEGVISVLRDGKKEYYYTDDELLYRAMTNINRKAWGTWMNFFRAPKRLLTTLVTLDPGFMIANFIRDAASSFVLSRDNVIPILSGIKGFGQALINDKPMRVMLSAGAAFERGYMNQGDPNTTQRMMKKAMKNKTFLKTILNTPAKLVEAYLKIGSAAENANRIAVYNAAIAAGKSKARAAFEAKDLMDFSMGGDWPFIQFLIQTVPFMGARMQGLHRLGRGFAENPTGFAMKGTMLMMAGLALWFAFRDDDRYKELEDWDKDVYFHWWIGEDHYRLPKPFEVGAIFNTIPERIMEYMYSEENDAGQLLMRRFGFMFAETFNFNPMPQTFRPMIESYFNYNFFTGRSIVSPYEEKRMAPEEYRYSTSPTMIELARSLPGGLDTASKKIRSPLHLENLFRGYTGTLGRYAMMGADAMVRYQQNYPVAPDWRVGDRPVTGRFIRGAEPRRNKYEEEVYRLINKTLEVQNSLRFLERSNQEMRFEDIETEFEPYIRVADDLEDIREDVSDINKEVFEIYMSRELTPQEKRKQIDVLQKDKNRLFELGYQLRPGGSLNPDTPVTQEQILDLMDNFGVDDVVASRLEATNPETFDLINALDSLGGADLRRLSEQK